MCDCRRGEVIPPLHRQKQDSNQERTQAEGLKEIINRDVAGRHSQIDYGDGMQNRADAKRPTSERIQARPLSNQREDGMHQTHGIKARRDAEPKNAGGHHSLND